MLDLVFGGILCALCTYLGMVAKQYYDKRYAYLKDFADFLSVLLDNMTYTKDNIVYVIEKYTGQNKGQFCKDINEYASIVKSGSVDAKDISDIFACKYLKKTEKAYISTFFSTLGTMDYDSQLARTKLSLAESEKLRDKAYKDSKSTGVMFSKLGLLLGIAIMIILA